MILAFTGKKQSGKSTASNLILTKIKLVRKINFKDALVKEIIENFPGVLDEISKSMEQHYWDGKEWTINRLFDEKPPLVRSLLQNYGTEVRRNDNENYWVDKWKEKLRTVIWSDVVCDDVRFLNEAQAVRDVGGYVIRIIREDMASTDSHSSETEMDSIVPDYTISVKTGEHSKLYAQLDQIIADIASKTRRDVA